MKLKKLIEGLSSLSVRGSLDLDVNGLCQDSRHFQPGDAFVAVRGSQFDGHLFINEASGKGASVLIVEDDRVVPIKYLGPVIKVEDTRRALDTLAANFFGRPSQKLFMAGVTGTNGKTTTTYFLETILNAAEIPSGVIGTIDNHYKTQKQETVNTTPGALEVQELLAKWATLGAKATAMEVTSIALAMRRVDSVEFDVAIFTNLTRDHLDFHKTMDEYIKTKARLFKEVLRKSSKKNKRAVLNAEDSHYKLMAPDQIPIWTFGFTKGDIQATDLRLNLDRSVFQLKTPLGTAEIEMPMIGKYMVANALGAIGAALHAGVKIDIIAGALKNMTPVKGRLEKVSTASPLRVFVDYAHSDDSLKNVLGFLKSLKEANNKIITVFGCGGDRDKGKRPLMMKAAQEFSDFVVVTSDNPRTEDPNKIISEIVDGALPGSVDLFTTEPDRRSAIELAIKKSSPGDVVLIAGKGHEDYQIIGAKKIPFDDIEVVKEYLKS